MRHARADTLQELEPVLRRLRELEGMRERSLGVFYVRSRAFLHFHEDPAGTFADIRSGSDWIRLPAMTQADADNLVRVAMRELRVSSGSPGGC